MTGLFRNMRGKALELSQSLYIHPHEIIEFNVKSPAARLELY